LLEATTPGPPKASGASQIVPLRGMILCHTGSTSLGTGEDSQAEDIPFGCCPHLERMFSLEAGHVHPHEAPDSLEVDNTRHQPFVSSLLVLSKRAAFFTI